MAASFDTRGRWRSLRNPGRAERLSRTDALLWRFIKSLAHRHGNQNFRGFFSGALGFWAI